MARAFISYSRRDSEFVGRLGPALRARGHDVWLDKEDIRAGEKWDRAVERALLESKLLIVVLTPNSVASEQVMDEVTYGIDGGMRIVPVLASPCRVPFRLARYQYVDFVPSFEDGLERLGAELSRTHHPSPVSATDPIQINAPSSLTDVQPRPTPPARISRLPTLAMLMGSAMLATGGMVLFHPDRQATTGEQPLPSPAAPVGAPTASGGTAPAPSAAGALEVAGNRSAPEPSTGMAVSATPSAVPAVDVPHSDLAVPAPTATVVSADPLVDAITAVLQQPEGTSASWTAADPARATSVVRAIARVWPDADAQSRAAKARRRLAIDMNERIPDGRALVQTLARTKMLVTFITSAKFGQGADFKMPLRMEMAANMPENVQRPSTSNDCAEMAGVLDILGRQEVIEAFPWIREACETCTAVTDAVVGKCGDI